MKRLICLVAVFVFFLLVNDYTYARSYQNEPDGFRGITWGASVKDMDGLVYTTTDPSYGGIKNYEKKGDEYKIGGANVTSIIYGFWEDKLFGVTIFFEGYVNWSALKGATFERFGDGYKHNRFMEEYLWFGDKTTMMLKYSEVLKKGSLRMSSKELSDQAQTKDKEKAKEGAKTGF